MQQQERVRRVVVCVALWSLFSLTLAHAQSEVKVALEEVVDDRFSEGSVQGSLQISMTLTGKDLDRATAARVIVKEARDDRGTDLVGDRDVPDFQSRDVNGGKLDARLRNPSREAKSIQLKGVVELFVPARDPGSKVRVDKALSRLDAPLTAKGLRAAKIEVTPLSARKYSEKMKLQELDEAAIAEIRAEGKKEGASDEEITQAIELIKALQELGGGPLPDGAVALSATTEDFDRIHRIEILGSDGKPMNITSRSTSSRGDDAVMILQPSEPPPPNATLEFILLTDKAKMSVPFDVKDVTLP